jgi:hypothetical protein
MNQLSDVKGTMTRPRQPFTLRDAMVLVAATAIGLAAARGLHDSIWSKTSMSVEAGSYSAISLEVARWTVIALPTAWAWTIALILLSLRIPQTSIHARLILPGSAACGAATIALTIGTINMLVVWVIIILQFGTTRPLVMGEVISDSILEIDLPGIGSPGLAVTIAWVALAVSGRWQPEPSWIDRLGRLMGCGWIGLMMLDPWILLILKGAWI